MSYGLPDGCTPADVDRAMDGDAPEDRRCKYCLTVGEHWCPNDICRPGLDDLTEDERAALAAEEE